MIKIEAAAKKLLLAIGCIIALSVGAQAKAIQLELIDNKWVIAYDSELFAGACIATMDYSLLKLKISFITAYPKEGTCAPCSARNCRKVRTAFELTG